MALIVSRGAEGRSYVVGRVLVRIEPGPLDTPCHLWQGYRRPDGYGARGDGLAHRKAWEDAHGPIPAKQQVHHRCYQRGCVNPEHLELVTTRKHAAAHAPASPCSHCGGTGIEPTRLHPLGGAA